MNCSYKYRIEPNEKQSEQIQLTIDACRYVWNYYLEKKKKAYESSGHYMNYYASSKDLTQLKKTKTNLSDVNASAMQSTLRDLDTAYKNFFRSSKTKDGLFRYPRFKSKHEQHCSFRIPNTANSIRIVDDKTVLIPSLGKVRCHISRPIVGRIISVTVVRNPSGEYYATFYCEAPNKAPLPQTGKSVGLDMGIKSLVVTSDGDKIENPNCMEKELRRLARLERSMSRKKCGSENWEKARLKVAQEYQKICNQRSDYLHMLSTELVRNYDLIAIEDLDITKMTSNPKYALPIHDAAWGELTRQLEYKCEWYGKDLEKIDRYYPSSQICSACSYRNRSTKNLSVREWTCPKCGAVHDRDVNAAKNILEEGIKQKK